MPTPPSTAACHTCVTVYESSRPTVDATSRGCTVLIEAACPPLPMARNEPTQQHVHVVRARDTPEP